MTDSRHRQLGRKSVLSVIWGGGGVILYNLIGLSSFIILARLLSPEDYGLMSASMIVVNLAIMVSDSFFGPSIIQRKAISVPVIHSAYTGALILGIGFSLCVAAASSVIAGFYRMPEIEPIVIGVAPLLVVRAVTAVPRGLMQRNLRYKALTWIGLLAAFADAIAGVTAAATGFGPWALIAAIYTNALISLGMAIWFERSSLGLSIDLRPAHQLLVGFGGGFALARLANFVARNVDNAVVGRMLGDQALGLYSRAYGLTNIAVNLGSGIAAQTIFPAFSMVQEDRVRIQAAFRLGLALMALMSLPVSAISVIAADALIRTMLGERWTDCILPFQLLMAVYFARSGYKATETLCIAVGYVYGAALREIIFAVLVFLGSVLGAQYGIVGVAALTSAAILAFYIISADLALRAVSMSWATFFSLHGSGGLLGVAVALPALSILLLAPNLSSLVMLMAQVGAGGLGMLIAVKIAPHIFLGDAGLWLLRTLADTAPATRSSIMWLVSTRERGPR